MPPVAAKAARMAFDCSAFTRGSCEAAKTSFSASIAISGMVNSAMTSIDSTARNFAYIGT